jgi:hypothetical protein
MPRLLPFSYDATVQPVAARHDKIVIWIDHHRYQGSLEEFKSFKSALADQYHGRIFQRPAAGPKSRLKIRTGERLGGPLFGGEYSFRVEEGDTPGGSQGINAQLRLTLNPTRFLRHQNPNKYNPARRNFPAPIATFFRRELVPDPEEDALDNEDNWIPDSAEYHTLSNPTLWPSIIRHYITGILVHIDSAIADAAGANVRSVRHPSERPFNVRYVESYFEFSDSNPTRTASNVEGLLRGYGDLGMTAKDYRIVGPRPWNGLSHVVVAKIRAGVLLRVYSKTNKRIRLEVTHDLTEAAVPKLKSEIEGEQRRHTAASLFGMYNILERTRVDAARVVNDVLRHMKGRAVLPATAKTAIDFLLDVVSTLGDSADARLIIWLLIDRRSITSNARLKPALRKLRRAGILDVQKRNRRREYIETEQYQYPLAMLREHGSAIHFTCSHRTRTTGRVP